MFGDSVYRSLRFCRILRGLALRTALDSVLVIVWGCWVDLGRGVVWRPVVRGSKTGVSQEGPYGCRVEKRYLGNGGYRFDRGCFR